jgi:hypothetical protein
MRRLCSLVGTLAILLWAQPVFAVVTCSNLTSSASTSAQSSYTTASITPTSNNLVIVYVSNTDSSSAATPTLSGTSLTWTQVGTWSPTAVRRFTVFRALGASPGSGTLTIDYAGDSQSAAQWTVDQCAGVTTAGTNGSAAVVANSTSITNNTGSYLNETDTGNSVTLSALSDANNATLGYVRNNGAGAITSGSGYTTLGTGGGFPQRSEYRQPGNTLVDFTWSSQSTATMVVALEITANNPSTGNKGMTLLGVQ